MDGLVFTGKWRLTVFGYPVHDDPGLTYPVTAGQGTDDDGTLFIVWVAPGPPDQYGFQSFLTRRWLGWDWGKLAWNAGPGGWFIEQESGTFLPSNGSYLIFDDAGEWIPLGPEGSPLRRQVVLPAFPLPGTAWKNADLRGLDLTGVDFSGKDLTNARFAGATVTLTDFTSATLTGARLKDAAVIDRPVLRGVTALHTDFSGINLSGADLGGSDLTRCIFQDAVLKGTGLAYTTLAGCTFQGATLAGADLASARMGGADFTGVDLTGVLVPTPPQPPTAAGGPGPAVLHGARLNAGLFGLDWRGLDLTGATLLQQGDLTGLMADRVVLAGVDLHGATLNKASLRQAVLSGAILTDAQLAGARLDGAQMGALVALFTLAPALQADLAAGPVNAALHAAFAHERIPLSAAAQVTVGVAGRVWLVTDGSTVYRVRRETRADGSQPLVVYRNGDAANLTGAYMPGAVLTDAVLYGATADHAQIYDGPEGTAQLSGAVLELASLAGANLSGADLTEAQMQGANLSGANLVNATLRRAALSPAADGTPARLTYASLQGATFTDARLEGADLSHAAAATAHGVYLLTLDTSYQADLAAAAQGNFQPDTSEVSLRPYLRTLDAGDLSLLRRAFQEQSIILSPAASVSTVASRAAQWAVTDGGSVYTVTMGVNDDGDGELDVSPGGQALDPEFTTAWLLALNTGNVAMLREPFRAIGITLSAAATVASQADRGSVWRLTDGALAWSLWTPLYDTGDASLYAQPTLERVGQAFTRAGQRLAWQATVSSESDGSWSVDSNSGDSADMYLGYVRFCVVPEADGLSVYGSELRVERLGSGNQLEIRLVVVKPTAGLDNYVMDGDTICPNGRSLRALRPPAWSDAWLRTPTPPAPPSCIPGPDGWCPPRSSAARAARE